VAAASSLAYAQGSFFTSLSGTVADSSGAVIPGADVKIRNNGTGAEYNTVTASDGGFSVPSLPGGTYSVTVSLMGFKTAVLRPRTPAFRSASAPPTSPATDRCSPTGRRRAAGTTNATGNAQASNSGDGFRLTGLLGDNQSRIIQLVFRVRW